MTSVMARSRKGALTVVLAWGLTLAGGAVAAPAVGQTTVPAAEGGTTTSSSVPSGDGAETPPSAPAPLPPIGGDQSGSPAVFVILSLVGTTVALAIMAVTWIRTRPD